MGFTPAAWQAWDTYNVLGKALLTLFLFISHFLIVTILITVLTNSFMAIVSNANEEHQFVFAVNAISMVKNDALFSYVAPSNILAWILTPLRYIMPFKEFVKLNRYVIKITHFPLLFSIYAYERLFLARSVYEPTDLIENRGRGRNRMVSFMDPEREGLFSPSVRIRQESVSGFQKDQALEEVFRLTPRGQLRSTMKSQERRSSAVNHWMDQHDGIASPPPEQDRSIVDRLERNRKTSRQTTASIIRRDRLGRQLSGTKSVGSEPADLMSVSRGASRDFAYAHSETDLPVISLEGGLPQTDDDGDDELITNEDDETNTFDRRSRDNRSNAHDEGNDRLDYFHTPTPAKFGSSLLSSSAASRRGFNGPPVSSSPKNRTPRRVHNRNLSTNTILFNPVSQPALPTKSSSSASPPPPVSRGHTNPRQTPAGTGTNTPTKRTVPAATKPRPIMPPHGQFKTAPNRSALHSLQPMNLNPSSSPRRQIRHRRSSLDMDITSDIGLPDPNIGAVPSSFATQMAMATGMVQRGTGGGGGDSSTDRLMGRLMLARMKTLEEGLDEVVRGFRDMKKTSVGVSLANSLRNSARNSTQQNTPNGSGDENRPPAKVKGKKPMRRQTKDTTRPSSAGRLEEMTPIRDTKQTPEETIIEGFLQKGSSF
jgi:hypothetical protein